MSAILEYPVVPRPIGRPADERRADYISAFAVVHSHPGRLLTPEMMDQLDHCPTKEAQRLLLGVSLQTINGEPILLPPNATMGAELIDPHQRNHTYLRAFDRSRYADAYLLSCCTEAQVQSSALAALAVRRIPALAVDSGAAKLRGQFGRALRNGGIESPGRYLAGMAGAASAGLSDIIGTLPGGRALFIECKAPLWLKVSLKTGDFVQSVRAGMPRPEQIAFLDTMHHAGALVGVIWSPEDLDELLEGRR